MKWNLTLFLSYTNMNTNIHKHNIISDDTQCLQSTNVCTLRPRIWAIASSNNGRIDYSHSMYTHKHRFEQCMSGTRHPHTLQRHEAACLRALGRITSTANQVHPIEMSTIRRTHILLDIHTLTTMISYICGMNEKTCQQIRTSGVRVFESLYLFPCN